MSAANRAAGEMNVAVEDIIELGPTPRFRTDRTPVVTESSLLQCRAVLALAGVEARRLLLHPINLAFVVYLGLGGGIESLSGGLPRADLLNLLVMIFAYYLPVLAIFPASLVASSARRAGASETLDALPIGPSGRTIALLVAAGAPAAIGGIAAVVIWRLGDGLSGGWFAATQPAALIALPLLYLGVIGLGVAAARWLPWPGAALVVAVGLVLWVATAVRSDQAAVVLTVPWLALSDDDSVLKVVGYSDFWHTTYLVALVALAWTAAILRDHLRLMLLVGVPLGGLTLLAGWAQLP